MSFISSAMAATHPSASSAHPNGGFLSALPMILIFAFAVYFLVIRPQNKRATEQKNLLSDLKIGDEVMTAGGIIARVKQFRDQFVVLEIASGIELTLQKNSISQLLPKGTLDQF